MFGTVLVADEAMDYRFEPGRQGYMHLARGKVRVGGFVLNAGDGLNIEKQERLELRGVDDAEVLLFDPP